MSGFGLKDEVKMVVNSLLVPHCKGLPLEKLLKEYKEYETRSLPYRDLGYNSPLDFLKSIPEVVTISTLPSGHIILQAKANEKTSHIQDLVKGQRNSNSFSVRAVNNLLRTAQQSMPYPRNLSSRTPFTQRSSTSYSSNQRPNNLGYQSRNPFGYSNNRGSSQEPVQTLRPPVNPSWPSYYEHDDRLKTVEPPAQLKPNVPSKPAFSSSTHDSLMYEREVVSNLKEVLQSYPDGVDMSLLYDLYEKTYKEPIVLPRIEKGISCVKFLQKHSDVFHLWTSTDQQSMVCLQEAHLKKERSASVELDRVVITRSTTGGPSRVENDGAGPFKFAAVDTRIRDSSSNSFQTLTVLPRMDEGAKASPRAPSSSKFSESSRSVGADGRFPATFGVMRPKVKNVVTENTIFLHEDFPPDLDPYDFFFVIVGEVYSPGKFYWFFSNNRKAIEELTDDMVAFYNVNPGYGMTRHELYVGQIVAAMYTDGLWYRGRILGTYRDEIEVFYIDYGSTGAVGIDRLRHLHLAFTRLPIQAFLSRIFGVLPYPNPAKWSPEAGKLLFNMVKGSKIMAAAVMAERVLDMNGHKVTEYALSLVDTTKETDVHVADQLIEQKYAILDQEEVNTSLPASVMDSPSTVGPSPQPTCPFPSSDHHLTMPDVASLSLSGDALQVTRTTDSGMSTVTSNLPVKGAHAAQACASPMQGTSEASSVPSKRPAKQFVKPLKLTDGRVLYIVKGDGELYLPVPDMAMIVPNFYEHLTSMKMKIEVKQIVQDTHPHIFLDCIKADAPWIRNSEGILTELILFPLNMVEPLLFILRVKDEEVVSVAKKYSSSPELIFS